MADTKISDETSAGTLDGTEIVPVVRVVAGSPITYLNRRSTVQEIADMTTGGLYDLSAGVPTLASLTAVNISGTTSSSENSGKGFSVKDTGKNTTSLAGYRKAVPGATPYLVAMLVLCSGSGLFQWTFGWSNGTAYETIGFVLGASPAGLTETWTNSTTRAGFGSPVNYGVGISPFWVGLKDDGTNRVFMVSSDGANFTTINSAAKSGAFLGGSGYTSIFLGVRPADTNNGVMTCVCYDEAGLSRVVR
jgi:hypothetical protein